MSESEISAERTATAVALSAELKYLEALALIRDKEKKRSESCGCRSCRVGYESALRIFDVEKFRVENRHDVDEEELWVSEVEKSK